LEEKKLLPAFNVVERLEGREIAQTQIEYSDVR